MAFDITCWGKMSSSANMKALSIWSYNATASGTDEAVATVIASGYFNELQQDLATDHGPLQVGDVILVHGNDATGFYVVTSITTNVTLASTAL